MNFVKSTNGCISTDEVAEPLGISAQKLHAFLHNMGVIKSRRHKWFLRTAYRGRGLEMRRKNKYKGRSGEVKYNSHLYWSYTGEQFIQNLWRQEQLKASARACVSQPELPLIWHNTPVLV